MASFNKVVLLGNLTRDVDLRYIPSGMAVANVGIAINDRRKKGEEWIDEVSFIDLTLWGRQAEVASEYTQKGSQVLIEGRLKTESWETEGVKKSKVGVVVEKLQLLGSKGSKPKTDDTPVASTVEPGTEEVPF